MSVVYDNVESMYVYNRSGFSYMMNLCVDFVNVFPFDERRELP